MPLQGRNVCLCVTGSIAAYKSVLLLRLLIKQGANVQVVLTASAQRFVGAPTFQALSSRAVRTDLWDEAAEAAMSHIELARWADCILIAPATANFLSQLSYGSANDLLTTLIVVGVSELLPVASAISSLATMLANSV